MVNPGARGRPRCRHNRRSMFLAIDIGNTRLKWALYAAPQRGAALQAHGAVFLETIDQLSEGEWKRLPAPGVLSRVRVPPWAMATPPAMATS